MPILLLILHVAVFASSVVYIILRRTQDPWIPRTISHSHSGIRTTITASSTRPRGSARVAFIFRDLTNIRYFVCLLLQPPSVGVPVQTQKEVIIVQARFSLSFIV